MTILYKTRFLHYSCLLQLMFKKRNTSYEFHKCCRENRTYIQRLCSSFLIPDTKLVPKFRVTFFSENEKHLKGSPDLFLEYLKRLYIVCSKFTQKAECGIQLPKTLLSVHMCLSLNFVSLVLLPQLSNFFLYYQALSKLESAFIFLRLYCLYQ